jgi:putative transposase
MKKTILVQHNTDYSSELAKAKLVAEWAVSNKYQCSSKHVKHIGLQSAISNQILKKYGNNKKAKSVSSVKLTIPNNNIGIRIIDKHEIYVPCIKASIRCWYDLSDVKKINQIEVDNKFYYITFEVDEDNQFEPNGYIGIDLNATEHMAVIAVNDKIIKRGRKARHIKRTYGSIRGRLQKKAQYKQLRKIKNKESRKIKDLNHKLSREIVDLAKAKQMGIRMEDLTNIRVRTNKKSNKKTRSITNNWNFYQLRQMIEYKSRICGVPIEFINPAYTSKSCSKCGALGIRTGKSFECDSCGHADHADANAAFNIASDMRIAYVRKVPDIKAVCESAESATAPRRGRLEAAPSSGAQ